MLGTHVVGAAVAVCVVYTVDQFITMVGLSWPSIPVIYGAVVVQQSMLMCQRAL